MGETKSKKTSLLFLFFRICFVVTGICLAIIWAAREERWRKLVQIDPLTFIFVLFIFVVTQTILVFRWWLLLRSQTIFIPFLSGVKLHFLGLFYNNCMPSSVGGDLIRAWYVTRHTDKKFEAALSVFVDRVIGLFSTLMIASFFYMVFLRGRDLDISTREGPGFTDTVSRHKSILIWLFVFILVVLFGFLSNAKGRELLKRAYLYFIGTASRIVGKFKNAVVLYCKKPLVLLEAFGITVFIQLTAITGFWLIGRSLGITASIKYYYVFFTLTWVLGAVPVSIGGAVVVEGMLIVLFVKFAGVNEASALALALSQRFVWLIASLPGVVIHLAGAHLPKEFFIDDQQAVN
jgi:uncharacterized protein (TIRG00374 family)